jgi:hypothetical protein
MAPGGACQFSMRRQQQQGGGWRSRVWTISEHTEGWPALFSLDGNNIIYTFLQYDRFALALVRWAGGGPGVGFEHEGEEFFDEFCGWELIVRHEMMSRDGYMRLYPWIIPNRPYYNINYHDWGYSRSLNSRSRLRSSSYGPTTAAWWSKGGNDSAIISATMRFCASEDSLVLLVELEFEMLVLGVVLVVLLALEVELGNGSMSMSDEFSRLWETVECGEEVSKAALTWGEGDEGGEVMLTVVVERKDAKLCGCSERVVRVVAYWRDQNQLEQ